MVDQCFQRPGTSSSNAALLDIITVESNGTTQTMRQQVVGGVTDQISAQFNGLTSGNAQQKIREDENVQKLLQTIQNFSMDFMMLPDLPAVAQEDPYKNMNLNQSLAKFFASSGACDDFEWDGQSTFGIESFSNALAQFGVPETPPHASCGQLVNCSGVPATDALACEAANSFMELKQGLRSVQTFKCKSFRDEIGSACTLTNMTHVDEGVYRNDSVAPSCGYHEAAFS